MLVLLSPAKTLDLDTPSRMATTTEPVFLDQADSLVRTVGRYSAKRLGMLMNISDSLATLNRDRFKAWDKDHSGDTVRPAIQAFRGDVYVGFDADTLTTDDLAFAQRHVRILSGLYGVLKPLDVMRAYRLEMGTKLPTRRGKTLYDFWGDRVARSLDEEASGMGGVPLVNLASNEYYGVVGKRKVDAPIVSPVFHDEKNGEYRTISFFAKRARGALARHLVQERASSIEAMRDFTGLGYRYSRRKSTVERPVFRRSEKAAAPYTVSPSGIT